jgi:hypothetical protein
MPVMRAIRLAPLTLTDRVVFVAATVMMDTLKSGCLLSWDAWVIGHYDQWSYRAAELRASLVIRNDL